MAFKNNIQNPHFDFFPIMFAIFPSFNYIFVISWTVMGHQEFIKKNWD